MVSRAQRSETRTEDQPVEQDRRLRLLGSPEPTLEQEPQSRPRVSWTEDTVDNEHLDRKKSKICCIFHPSKEFGESSEEEESDVSYSSSSSSSSDSDSDSDGAVAHNHNHNGNANCSHRRHRRHHKPRPNAYERLPKVNR